MCAETLAALPAGRVGEPPGAVRAEALVAGHDLGGGQRDPGERCPHLPDCAGGLDQRCAGALTLATRAEDLRERELVGGLSFQPSQREVQARLRIARRLGVADCVATFELV